MATIVSKYTGSGKLGTMMSYFGSSVRSPLSTNWLKTEPMPRNPAHCVNFRMVLKKLIVGKAPPFLSPRQRMWRTPMATASQSPHGPASDTPGQQKRNRLAGEKSPYLLQHAHNPVDW